MLPLSGNFRSRPEVIATANRLGELLLPGFRELTVGSAEQARRRPPGGAPRGRAAAHRAEGLGGARPRTRRRRPHQPEEVLAEARHLAERLRELAEAGVPRREMVVLLRAFTRVDAYEEALDRAGLRPYVVGGRGYWSGQQVGDPAALLRVIANPLDDEALLGALSSPAFGVSPDALWLLRRAAARGGPLWPALLVASATPAAASSTSREWLEHRRPEDRRRLRGARVDGRRAARGRHPALA